MWRRREEEEQGQLGLETGLKAGRERTDGSARLVSLELLQVKVLHEVYRRDSDY